MTSPLHLTTPNTRAGLSLLAYHGVALIAALVLLFKSIDVAATAFPMIATSQIWAAVVWCSGAWLAPVLLGGLYQLRYWWLLVLLGVGQPMAALFVSNLVLKQAPVSSWINDHASVEAAIGFSLYGAASSLLYILFLKVSSRRKALSD